MNKVCVFKAKDLTEVEIELLIQASYEIEQAIKAAMRSRLTLSKLIYKKSLEAVEPTKDCDIIELSHRAMDNIDGFRETDKAIYTAFKSLEAVQTELNNMLGISVI